MIKWRVPNQVIFTYTNTGTIDYITIIIYWTKATIRLFFFCFFLGKWIINPQELTFEQEIGVGEFGVVHLGNWLDRMKVAIKTIRTGTMSEEDFIEEAQVMM